MRYSARNKADCVEKIKKFLVQNRVSVVHFREVEVLENFTDVASAVNGRVIRDAEVFASFPGPGIRIGHNGGDAAINRENSGVKSGSNREAMVVAFEERGPPAVIREKFQSSSHGLGQ